MDVATSVCGSIGTRSFRQLGLAELLTLCYNVNGCFVTLNWENMRRKWKPPSANSGQRQSFQSRMSAAVPHARGAGSYSRICFAEDGSKMFAALTEKAVPGLASSIFLTFLSLASAPVGKQMPISIGPKDCQEQTPVFNYTNFTWMTFAVWLEQSFVTS